MGRHRVSGSEAGSKNTRTGPAAWKMKRGVNRSRKLSHVALQARTFLP